MNQSEAVLVLNIFQSFQWNINTVNWLLLSRLKCYNIHVHKTEVWIRQPFFNRFRRGRSSLNVHEVSLMNKSLFGPVAELLCFIEYINIVYGGVSSFPEIIWLSQQTSKMRSWNPLLVILVGLPGVSAVFKGCKQCNHSFKLKNIVRLMYIYLIWIYNNISCLMFGSNKTNYTHNLDS